MAMLLFRKNAWAKSETSRAEGRTVLFVSHNMLAVDNLCTRAICLHEGRVVLEGSPASVTSRYLQNWLPAFKEVVYDDIETAPGNDMIRLHRARVRPLHGFPADQLTVRTPFAVEFECWKLAARTRLSLVAEVSNEHGVTVFVTADKDESASSGRFAANLLYSARRLDEQRHLPDRPFCMPEWRWRSTWSLNGKTFWPLRFTMPPVNCAVPTMANGLAR